MSDAALQIRVLMFALIFPFSRAAQDYGFDMAVMVFAVVLAFLSLATSWFDGRARR